MPLDENTSKKELIAVINRQDDQIAEVRRWWVEQRQTAVLAAHAATQRHAGGSDAELGKSFARGADTLPAWASAGNWSKDVKPAHIGGVLVSGGYDQLGRYHRGLLDPQQPVNDWHREALDLWDMYGLLRQAVPANHTESRASRTVRELMVRHWRQAPAAFKAAADSFVKAFDGDTATGAEWREVRTSPMLEEMVTNARVLASIFPTQEAPSRNWKVPALETDAQTFLHSSSLGDDPAQYAVTELTTNERNRAVVGLKTRIVLTDDAVEDSIFDAVTAARLSLTRAAEDAEEDAIINGDDNGTHQDTLTAWSARSRWRVYGGTNDHRRAWKGLRRLSAIQGTSSDGSSRQTYAGLCEATARLDAGMLSRGKVVVSSPEYYQKKMMAMDTFATVEKFGNLATILTGQIARIANMPLLISDFMTADLNASGVFDNVTKTKSGYLVFAPDRFMRWTYRGVQLGSQRDETRGITHLVMTQRHAFAIRGQTTEKNVSYEYNLL